MEELRAHTAADEEDLIVVGNLHKLAEQRLRLVYHSLELGRAMRDRKQRKTGAAEFDYGLGRILDNYLRQNRGSRIEVVFFHS